MSYCRWSTDDFQCDIYAYADVSGGYTIHVAGMKRVIKEPLPPPVDMNKDIQAWCERDDKVMKIVQASELVPVGLPHDGADFYGLDLPKFLETMLMLRKEGYRFPDYALDEIRAEIAEDREPTERSDASSPRG